MYVCLWSPDWSTDAASAADGGGGRSADGDADRSRSDDASQSSTHDHATALARLAPRLRVEREVIWADGRGLDAGALAQQLVERAAEDGVRVRAGVAAVPVTAELAARWGPRPAAGTDATPFLVKERTGWGWRRPSDPSDPSNPSPASSPHPPNGVPHSPSPPPGGGVEEGRSPSRGGGNGKGRSGHSSSPPQGGGKGRSPHLPSPPRGGGGVVRRPLGRGEVGRGSPPRDSGGGVVVVEQGGEAGWQAALPVAALRPPDRLRALLDGVGIRMVGDLASLEREAVEVRFGGGAVPLWRHARAADRRLLFDRIPRDRPHGSIDFVDYVLTDPSRLLFTANALLGPICEGLMDRGEHARTLRLELPLANGETWERTLRPARPTASRDTWLRLIRGLLDRLTVPDAVAGMRIEVPTTEPAAVRQGDLFDRGFATASAVEAAVARLAERQVWPVTPDADGHPRIERRGSWKPQPIPEAVHARAHSHPRAHPQSPPPSRRERANVAGQDPDPRTGVHDDVGSPHGGAVGKGEVPPSGDGARPGLTLQLVAEPRRLTVETAARRDHEVPVRLRDRRGWRKVILAAGPDRISGGQWEAASYAREYFRCVTDEGVLLWIFRDALDGGWYLHGWWD